MKTTKTLILLTFLMVSPVFGDTYSDGSPFKSTKASFLDLKFILSSSLRLLFFCIFYSFYFLEYDYYQFLFLFFIPYKSCPYNYCIYNYISDINQVIFVIYPKEQLYAQLNKHPDVCSMGRACSLFTQHFDELSPVHNYLNKESLTS